MVIVAVAVVAVVFSEAGEEGVHWIKEQDWMAPFQQHDDGAPSPKVGDAGPTEAPRSEPAAADPTGVPTPSPSNVPPSPSAFVGSGPLDERRSDHVILQSDGGGERATTKKCLEEGVYAFEITNTGDGGDDFAGPCIACHYRV